MPVTIPICGIGVGEGAALGRLCWLADAPRPAPARAVGRRAPDEERARFDAALAQAVAELERLAEEARDEVGDEAAQIFATHAMIAAEEDFTEPVYAHIAAGERAEQAVILASEALAARFRAMDDAYLRARAADFADIAARLCDGLGEAAGKTELPPGDEPLIIAARDLTPSRTIGLDRTRVAGFVTVVGSSGSHTAILARSLGLPALVGVGDDSLASLDGARVLLDAAAGQLTVDPDPTALAGYYAREASREAEAAARAAAVGLPAVTRSGRAVKLYANIGRPEEAAEAVAQGAAGVGLFRSEFLYLGRAAPPGEEEQVAAYLAAAEALGDRPLIIRTLDLGADKRAEGIDLPPEENPALGLRAIRLCLRRRDLFDVQLRAICRVAGMRPGQVGVMFPMIALPRELDAAREALAEAQARLAAEGVAVDRAMQVGMMIETPASALCAEAFAGQVDFFSVGSNDLVQYTLAVDRLNGAVADLASGFPEAVRRLIALAADAIHAAGGWIGLCGELAADAALVEDLLALGLDELSVAPAHLGRIKEAIRDCE